MANISPYSFIVVLPQAIIEIPQSSNLSWMTLFHALPKELVEKRAEYLELPHNIHQVLQSKKYTAIIQTDSFLELVWDCYAWSAWQFSRSPIKMEHTTIFPVIGRTTPVTSHCGDCPMKSSSISARNSRTKWNGASKGYS